MCVCESVCGRGRGGGCLSAMMGKDGYKNCMEKVILLDDRSDDINESC